MFQLQRETGINDDNLNNLFIHCYGARLSLDTSKNDFIHRIEYVINETFYCKSKLDSKVADQNALLVLENIKFKGFQIGDRTKGFNKRDTELILEVNLIDFSAKRTTDNEQVITLSLPSSAQNS